MAEGVNHAPKERMATGGGSWERQRRRTTLLLVTAPLAAMLLLFVLPLAELLWLSIGGGGHLSLAAYGELMRPVYFRLTLFTLELALAVTLLCLLLGYPLAYLLANLGGRQARWI